MGWGGVGWGGVSTLCRWGVLAGWGVEVGDGVCTMVQHGKRLLPPVASIAPTTPPRPSPLHPHPASRVMHKHATELAHMRDPSHDNVIALVELSLAVMRLSCERFFSLLAVS